MRSFSLVVLSRNVSAGDTSGDTEQSARDPAPAASVSLIKQVATEVLICRRQLPLEPPLPPRDHRATARNREDEFKGPLFEFCYCYSGNLCQCI